MIPSNAPRRSTNRYGPRAGYDAAAAFYDDWGWQTFWRSNEWPFIQDMLTSDSAPRSVLDVGLGTGAYLERIGQEYPTACLVGLDISERMLSRARDRLDKTAWLICADARAIPFAREEFDLVLMTRVASHIPNVSEVVLEIARVLRSGGTAVVSDVSPDHDYSCTALPTHRGKIRVETHKHLRADWGAASVRAGLHVCNSIEISVTNAPRPETYPRSIGRLGKQPVGFIVAYRKG